METTIKETANILASLFKEHGVKHFVCSPGSRNAPLIVAINRLDAFDTTVVIDERSAAFVALGLCMIDAGPVALVCTSGTALLNYLPAIAEARYRKLPLIVISADRPFQWIDQADSQTLPQPGALGRFVKMAVDIQDCDDRQSLWYVNRVINDALLTSVSDTPGPVHINMQLDKPLGGLTQRRVGNNDRVVSRYHADLLPQQVVSQINSDMAGFDRIMVVAGFMQPSTELVKAVRKWNVGNKAVVIAEQISNLKGVGEISRVNSTLSHIDENEIDQYRPDLIITMGGALVSQQLKTFLRSCTKSAHWHVGYEENLIDCYGILTCEYRCLPASFFMQLSPLRENALSCYSHRWTEVSNHAPGLFDSHPLINVMSKMPAGWNLQLSNGLSVRVALEMPLNRFNRVDCNRGVSGIDGSTSTAIGMAIGDKSTVTLLVTGDMSAAYDIGALAISDIPERFKMIVLNNSGGGIFRGIESTASLPELKRFFDVKPQLPLKQLADAYCFHYYDEAEIDSFINDTSAPAIMELKA